MKVIPVRTSNRKCVDNSNQNDPQSTKKIHSISFQSILKKMSSESSSIDEEHEALIPRAKNQAHKNRFSESDYIDEDDYSYLDTIVLAIKTIHLFVSQKVLLLLSFIVVLGLVLLQIISLFQNGDSTFVSNMKTFIQSTMVVSSKSDSTIPIISPLNGYSYKNLSTNICAPWIPKERRRIIIRKHERLNDWSSYQNGTGYLGGEGYWSASLMFLLQSLDFDVEIDNHLPYGNTTDMDRILHKKEIYRVIVDHHFNKDNFTKEIQNESEAMCKIRHFEWWERSDKKIRQQYNDPRKVITPFPYHNSSSTHIAFFVHSELTLPPIVNMERRGREAMLLDKNCAFPKKVLLGLVDAGYKLHLTCHHLEDQENIKSMIPSGSSKYTENIIFYNVMKPIEFSKMLRKVSVVIGYGNPRDSPTPFEGLANGAAFLNPVSVSGIYTQHKILRTLGAPYVYNYVRSPSAAITLKNILKLAEIALLHPFGSYIPFHYRFHVAREQVCANLIEADSLCECNKINDAGSNASIKMDFCKAHF